MKLNGLTGSIVALITPFHEDGSVNFHKLGELVEFHISHGTDGHPDSGHHRRVRHHDP